MVVGSTIRDLWDIVVVAMTPHERWSAARQIDSGFMSEYGVVLLIGLVLFVLIVLLWWVSSWHHARDMESKQERFGRNAIHRGLTGREQQILLAVAMRSGLRHSEKVFVSSSGFDKGARKLLSEFARTRTPQENERLTAEVASLREKLGFAAAGPPGQRAAEGRPTSQSIPVGERVELLAQRQQERAPVEGTVVRNDDIELAVELDSVVEGAVDAYWRVRYCQGMSIWEFETAASSCEGSRLILNHSRRIRFVNRRRFPRTPSNRKALVAAFPFVRDIRPGQLRPPTELHPVEPTRSGNGVPPALPEFIDGVVTEMGGPGLRLRSSLRVDTGDRVLILFDVTDGPFTAEEENPLARMIEHIGYVRHCESVGDELLLAVELTGLNSIEMEELIRCAGFAASLFGTTDLNSAAHEDGTEGRSDARTAVNEHVRQGV